MVKQGGFSVELVQEGETRAPFPEHLGPDGRYYAEVEPNAEYWIRLQANVPENQVYMCNLEIDGTPLGFCTYIYDDQAFDEGIWNQVGEEDTTTAFRFQSLGNDGGGNEKNGAFYIGHVTVDFLEAIEEGDCEEPDFRNDWTGGDVDHCNGGGGTTKKALASAAGTTTVTFERTRGPEIRYEQGQFLQSITLHYCTAVGLIHVGVLPPPSSGYSWEHHRLQYPALPAAKAKINTKWIDMIQSEIITLPFCDASGVVLRENTMEVFDLTKLKDDDDDEHDREKSPATVSS